MTETKKAKEQRRHPRFDVSLVAAVESCSESVEVIILDFSKIGAKIEFIDPLKLPNDPVVMLAVAMEGRIYRASFECIWKKDSRMGLHLLPDNNDWEILLSSLIPKD